MIGAASGLDAVRARAEAAVRAQIVPLVDAFRRLQGPSGSVVGDHGAAREILGRLRAPVARTYAELGMDAAAAAFCEDVDAWLAGGLGKPCFDATLAACEAPADGGLAFFVGPLKATNGPPPRGHFLEAFLVERREPPELAEVEARLPHPLNGCQSARLLAGSHGIATGNCIVFFPENIATSKAVEAQKFALFFFNKFHRIYARQTIPRVQAIVAPARWRSAELGPEECYAARCLWGYLHDLFHHRGPRPFHTNMRVKMTFDMGLLEEIKVDAQSAVAAHELALPYAREVIEFILLERLFRYPAQPDATTNFDAGTGILLFEWLRGQEGAIVEGPDGLRIDVDACVVGMARLAEAIEEIEREPDDAEFVRRAKAFLRAYVPAGRDGRRFELPPSCAAIADMRGGDEPPLQFHDLPF